ncbi:MAG: RNA polymerase Rpb4 family protein [Candidatus Aenigmatarchaeota archaeon]
MEVLKEEFITDAEAKEILEARGKETELKYEQKNALDVLRKFIKMDVEKAKKLVEELKKIPNLRERQIVAIVNFMPQDRDDLRAILHKEYTSFSEEDITLILEAVKKF